MVPLNNCFTRKTYMSSHSNSVVVNKSNKRGVSLSILSNEMIDIF